MAQVAISFNKRTYRFECSDGDAARLTSITEYLKEKLDELSREHGPTGDERLVLMAALMVTDELFEARADIDALLEEQTEKLQTVSQTTQQPKPQTVEVPRAGEQRTGSAADLGRKTGN